MGVFSEEGNMKVSYLLVAVVISLIFSCAGAPEKEPEKVPEKEPEETVAAVPAPEEELAKAKKLRDLIVRFELDKIAVQEFNSADNNLKEGEAAYGKDNEAAKVSLEKAIEGYRAVIKAGFDKISKKRKDEIESVKREADELKASVALPEEYKVADETYRKALENEKAGDYEQALEGFDRSLVLFRDVRDRALEKKLRAEKALDEAKSGITNAEKKAKELEEEEKADREGGAQ
jgi:hypothetical protein